jgi:hypothetical protein
MKLAANLLAAHSMKRRQASLYLPDQFNIESFRLRFNRAQALLIPSHVTLCREDEVDDWDALRARLESLSPFELTLGFGAPVRENNFVFLPVTEGLNSFHEFRCAVLTQEARQHVPHVTIIHPRNGTCTDPIFADALATISSFRYTFREVMLIEQEGEGAWNVIARVGR